MAIKINLDDLTQEHIDRCAPNLGTCRYDGPCIIGTLASDWPPECEGDTIKGLVDRGAVEIADDQLEDAEDLQYAFDRANTRLLTDLLAKRGLKWPSPAFVEGSE